MQTFKVIAVGVIFAAVAASGVMAVSAPLRERAISVLVSHLEAHPTDELAIIVGQLLLDGESEEIGASPSSITNFTSIELSGNSPSLVNVARRDMTISTTTPCSILNTDTRSRIITNGFLDLDAAPVGAVTSTFILGVTSTIQGTALAASTVVGPITFSTSSAQQIVNTTTPRYIIWPANQYVTLNSSVSTTQTGRCEVFYSVRRDQF